MFILTSSQSFVRVWVFWLKDSIPCPIPVGSLEDNDPPPLLIVNIQERVVHAIVNWSGFDLAQALRKPLLRKGHKSMRRIERKFTFD
jgi:hypothetical protein